VWSPDDPSADADGLLRVGGRRHPAGRHRHRRRQRTCEARGTSSCAARRTASAPRHRCGGRQQVVTTPPLGFTQQPRLVPGSAAARAAAELARVRPAWPGLPATAVRPGTGCDLHPACLCRKRDLPRRRRGDRSGLSIRHRCAPPGCRWCRSTLAGQVVLTSGAVHYYRNLDAETVPVLVSPSTTSRRCTAWGSGRRPRPPRAGATRGAAGYPRHGRAGGRDRPPRRRPGDAWRSPGVKMRRDHRGAGHPAGRRGSTRRGRESTSTVPAP
jgi:hypothetical protein